MEGKGASTLTEPSRAGVHRWWPFALLLVAGASRWVVAAAHPEADSTIASEAMGCGWAALLSYLFLVRKSAAISSPMASSDTGRVRSFLAGAMLFGGPAIALLIRGRQIDAGSLTVALALTPIILAIAVSALGSERTDDLAGRIWPGLAAVTGLLLVLAQPALGDARSDLALVLAPALTGIGAALFCADTNLSATRVSLALVGSTALFTLALAGTYILAGSLPSVSLLAVACDGVLALLSVVTLYQLGATRWSSQFTWIPLLIVVESLVLVRPQLSAHWVIGLGLLALASIYLLLPQSEEPKSGVSAVPS